MADTKISALTAADALDGTEALPVVQGSATKKTLVSAIATYLQALTGLNFPNAVRFATIELGAASDTTLARSAAGAITIEGRGVFRELDANAAESNTHTGDTNEHTFATITVPANALGAKGVLRITAQWGLTTSNTKTTRIRFNGTEVSANATTTSLSSRQQAQIQNRNNTAKQVANATNQVNFGGSSTAPVTMTHDTTGALDITITGQLTNTGESITLESYLVEILHKS